MKVAITAQAQTMDSLVDPRFGRAKYFLLVDTETGDHQAIDNVQNLNAAQGAGIQSGQNVVNMGAEAVITGNVGPKAFRTLEAAQVKIFRCQEELTVRAAIEKFQAGQLTQVDQANVEGHWI